jgi:arylformamidase
MEAIYRTFDRPALDREYSPSQAASAGLEHYLARYASLSEEALAGPGVMRDVRYGPHPDDLLDLFLPDGEGPWPLHVFIHGGFWQALSQRDFGFIGPAFQARQTAYVSLNYSLAPAATIGQMVDQCARGLAWLYANAGRLRLDPARITISGHSAGAHLAAMLLSCDWAALGAPPDTIKGALLISGVYDLEPIRLSYVDVPLGLSAADVAAWSPLRLAPTANCPVAIVWGESDTAEFRRQSRDYAAWLGRLQRAVTSYEFAGRDHFDILFEFLSCPSRLMDAALELPV